MGAATEDGSNGYEAVANIYIAGPGTRARVGDSIGAGVVKAWAATFPPGATVLDLGSGPGEPSTRILHQRAWRSVQLLGLTEPIAPCNALPLHHTGVNYGPQNLPLDARRRFDGGGSQHSGSSPR
jgi:hypothetical protein